MIIDPVFILQCKGPKTVIVLLWSGNRTVNDHISSQIYHFYNSAFGHIILVMVSGTTKVYPFSLLLVVRYEIIECKHSIISMVILDLDPIFV